MYHMKDAGTLVCVPKVTDAAANSVNSDSAGLVIFYTVRCQYGGVASEDIVLFTCVCL